MAGLYYEEFKVGMKFEHPWTRTVTEMDNILFSSLTMNVQPLHLDAHFSAKTPYGKQLVNSIFTLGLIIGISVNDTTTGTTLGNLGMTEVRFPKPVFHGDTLRATTEIIGMRESKSRREAGIVEFLHQGWNQNGEEIAICKRQGMILKRPKA